MVLSVGIKNIHTRNFLCGRGLLGRHLLTGCFCCLFFSSLFLKFLNSSFKLLNLRLDHLHLTFVFCILRAVILWCGKEDDILSTIKRERGEYDDWYDCFSEFDFGRTLF